MSSLRAKRLRRLLKASKFLYLQETAELARLNAAEAEVANRAAAAELYLQAGGTDLTFLAELAIAHAGKLREDHAEAQARLESQVEKATSVMTKAKGVENLLEAERGQIEKSQTVRALEEIIDRVGGRKFSPGQAGDPTNDSRAADPHSLEASRIAGESWGRGAR